MSLSLTRRQVVRHYEYPPAFIFLQGLIYRANDVFIDSLDRFFLHIGISRVAGLVWAFNMDKNYIVFFKSLNRGVGFSIVICVRKTCRTFDFDKVKAYQFRKSAHKVNGGNRHAFKAEPALEAVHRGLFTLSPQPDGTYGVLA